MGFRIFASGTGDYRRSRDGLTFGDAFEAGGAMSRALSLSGSPAEIAGGELARQVEGESNLQRVTELYGRIIGVDLFVTMVTLAVARFNGFHLFVSARESHLVLPDDADHWEGWIGNPTADDIRRGHGQSAGQYCLEMVVPTLRETDMMNFGVLAAMARVFSEWTSEGNRPRRGDPRIMIQLSH